MNSGWLVSLLAGLFGLVLVLRMVPWWRLLPRRLDEPAIARHRARAKAARTAWARAAALEDAGRAAEASGAHQRAAGYYHRALRHDPTRTQALDRLVALYLRTGALRRLERALWEFVEDGSPALSHAAQRHLGALYKGPLADSVRAHAMREILG